MDYGSTPQIKQPEYLMFSRGCRRVIWPPEGIFALEETNFNEHGYARWGGSTDDC
jgi:hypothetical protein